MRRILFFILVLLAGFFFGWLLEQGVSFLPGSLANVFMRSYGVGIHPLSILFTLCGLLGLIAGFLLVDKFIRK